MFLLPRGQHEFPTQEGSLISKKTWLKSNFTLHKTSNGLYCLHPNDLYRGSSGCRVCQSDASSKRMITNRIPANDRFFSLDKHSSTNLPARLFHAAQCKMASFYTSTCPFNNGEPSCCCRRCCCWWWWTCQWSDKGSSPSKSNRPRMSSKPLSRCVGPLWRH